jgi:hypothetical protein
MAQINKPSITTDFLPPASPIERILIAHLNLHAVCDNGKSLGENASLEEISEEILFYHRGIPIGLTVGQEDEDWNLTPAISNSSCLEEAVNFLGLCKALYTLPSSLNISHQSGRNDHGSDDSRVDSEIDSEMDSEDDRTTSIYFGNSILIFVPLESTLDVVAVVQVSRLYQNGIKSDTGSGNPLAISASIERTHRLFCILHGGGIEYRLDETSPPKNSVNNTTRYLGMKKLFGLLKGIRENKDILLRQGGSSTLDQNTEEIIHRIAELEGEVKSCRKSLPIQSLRRDLESHYNEYLSYFLEVCMRNGGAGRCLVEMMPVPIAQDSGSHVVQLPPSEIEQRHLESLEKSILQIIQSHSSCAQNEKYSDSDSSLLGIAIFQSSRLLHSYSNSERVNLSSDTVSLLMAYMASYRTKMRYAAMSIGRTTSVSTSSLPEPQLGLLKRLGFHLGPMVDKTPNHTAMPRKWEDTNEASNNNLTHKGTHPRGRFLTSPPPFMLGVSDQPYSLHYDNNRQDVWAPRVHLPVARGTNRSRNADAVTDDSLVAHMAVFEFLEFSFLIFINLPSLDHPDPSEQSETILLLMDLEEKLSEAIIDAFHDEPSVFACTESISTDFTNEPGQDFVLVERSKERMILLLDLELQSQRFDKKKRDVFSNKNKSQMRRFMGFGPRKKENVSQSQPSSRRSTTVEWSVLGLDCRHLLASRLPLDICLAFDDMINEVRNAKHTTTSSLTKGKGKEDKLASSILELCTCMPYGWMYALAAQEKEIYVFFDSSIYVTVADVQSAVLRIKERYIVTI